MNDRGQGVGEEGWEVHVTHWEAVSPAERESWPSGWGTVVADHQVWLLLMEAVVKRGSSGFSGNASFSVLPEVRP